MKTVTALSLGAGVGSVGLSLLFARGMLDGWLQPDVAIFADTHAEPPHVYEQLDWLETQVPWPIIRTDCGLSLDDVVDRQSRMLPVGKPLSQKEGNHCLPLYIWGGGMATRQCTTHFKIAPIRRAVREWAGANPPFLCVNQYLGITRDEAHRMRGSDRAYITNLYPMVLDGWTRDRLVQWMADEYPGLTVKRSSCYFCPFHNMREWLDLRRDYPDLYQRALEMDDRLLAYDPAEVTAKVPFRHYPFSFVKNKYGFGLREVMANYDRQGQLEGFEPDGFGNDCSGVCGV